jgi:hypothetical protein
MDEVKQEHDMHEVDMLSIYFCSYDRCLGRHLLIVKESFWSKLPKTMLSLANFGLPNEQVDVGRMTALFLAW